VKRVIAVPITKRAAALPPRLAASAPIPVRTVKGATGKMAPTAKSTNDLPGVANEHQSNPEGGLFVRSVVVPSQNDEQAVGPLSK
jgi:hypothetical protein